MYLNSGGTPEYCKGYGIEFTLDNLEKSIDDAMQDYEWHIEKMKSYPFSSERMCDEYNKLFLNLTENKLEVISSRKLKNKSNQLFKNIYLLIRKITEIFSN